jgi:hypothetical protein
MEIPFMTYNLESGTTAERMCLKGDVDNFFNFKGIRVDGVAADALRHRNRPDGVFALQMTTSTGTRRDMLLFYEGDVHAKDSGKKDSGCPNCHKMYQCMAQCHAKSPTMAGCAVFAAMEYATSDKIVSFLQDMFVAHVFVFTAMTHYNYMLDTPRIARSNARAPTFLGSILKLQPEVDYDFVIGINMAYKTDAQPFASTSFFDKRITSMLNGLHQTANVTIELDDNFQNIVGTEHHQFTIGSVTIVFVAIPRAPRDALKNGVVPGFLYPMHMREIITWQGDDATLANGCYAANNILKVTMLNGLDFKLKKKMMLNTSVLTFQGAVGNTALDCTTGFFYIAIPLAYYTTQQFDFINYHFDYSYCVSKIKFKELLEIFKDTMRTTNTLKSSVLMFKNNNNSLFHEICVRTHSYTEEIAGDFKLFLCEVCRWKDADVNQPASPDIFFRTLGIYSLQNAIDFAFEVKQNQNATYSTLLSSYPVGAQMTIKQCMKKLTENEAYAYIHRDDLVTAISALTLHAPDDDGGPPDPLLQAWQAFEELVGDGFEVSNWSVEFPNATLDQKAAFLQTSQDQSLLRTILVHSYKKTLLRWNKTVQPDTNPIPATGGVYQEFQNGAKLRLGILAGESPATASTLNFIRLQYAVDMPSFDTRYQMNLDGSELILEPDHAGRQFRLQYKDIAAQLRQTIRQTSNLPTTLYVEEGTYFMKFTTTAAIFTGDRMLTLFNNAASAIARSIFPALDDVAQPDRKSVV